MRINIGNWCRFLKDLGDMRHVALAGGGGQPSWPKCDSRSCHIGGGGRKVIVTGLCVSIKKWMRMRGKRGGEEGGESDCGRIGRGASTLYCICDNFRLCCCTGRARAYRVVKSSDSKSLRKKNSYRKTPPAGQGQPAGPGHLARRRPSSQQGHLAVLGQLAELGQQ